MDEKIIEKLKDTDFFKELVTLPDEQKVKEAFKKSNIEISNDDLSDIKEFINLVLESSSKLSDEDLKDISGGDHKEGIVHCLADRLAAAADTNESDEYYTGWVAENSHPIVEAALATIITGLSVGGTIGVQKLIEKGKEKGWWGKKK